MADKSPLELDINIIRKLTNEEVEFVLQHSEKLLAESSKISDSIVGKTTTLLTLIVGLLAALMGYTIGQWDEKGVSDPLTKTGAIGCLILFVLSAISSFNLHPRKYTFIGSDPVSLLNPKLFEDNFKQDKRLHTIYVNEIESYQKRIQWNKKINKRGWMFFKITLYATILAPFAIALAYYLIIR